MFAGATREVVFSNPKVVRRVNEEFIPVALKAGLVNNPPRGIEGSLYAEIARSKPAPQGICSTNSAGKVLTWALSFDNDASILEYLDHVQSRYVRSPDAKKPVIAERYRKYPSRKLPNVEDTEQAISVPSRHAKGERCPAVPVLEKGTLVGRIVGRPLDKTGKPIRETTRQEQYMEARFEIPVEVQRQLVTAARDAKGKRFELPQAFSRALIAPAYLGQLDVNPLGTVPGSRNDSREWQFFGEAVPIKDSELLRLRIVGTSHVEGGQAFGRDPRSDGRLWEHRVSLGWQGYIEIRGDRITQLVVLAEGKERLRWGNPRFHQLREADVEHLMAGHPIDLDCAVRYGLLAESPSR